jgi:hypothetical protein
VNRINQFSNLNFKNRPRASPTQLLVVGAVFLIFNLLWFIVPQGVLYWLLMPVLLCLTWAASNGWRRTVATLIEFLHSLLEIGE